MAIYIQSCGIAQDDDYRWLRIKPDCSEPENPALLLQPIPNLSIKPIELIKSQKFSVILLSLSQELCLLITGLKARTARTDFMGRQIRNSVLWTCKKDQENKKIRSLLILALQGELAHKIDQTIAIGGKYGFKVDYQSLKKLSNTTLEVENNANTNLNYKIGTNSESLRQEVSLELQTNPLPEREGLLVLVTSIKSASAVKQTRVWRGLSDRIEAQELTTYSQSTNLTKANSPVQKKTVGRIIAIALVLLILSFTLIQLTKQSIPQPQIQPLPPNIANRVLLN